MTEKSSDEEVLKKIHKILDDSSSDTLERDQDKYLSSLKQRLSPASHTPSYSQHQPFNTDTDLRPRIVIHKKKKSLDRVKKTEKEGVEFIPSPGITLSDKELFEVDKPISESDDIPDFIEVKPAQDNVISKEKTIIDTEDIPEFTEIKGDQKDTISKDEPLTIKVRSETEKDRSLPQWEPLQEGKSTESLPQWETVDDIESTPKPSEVKTIPQKNKSNFNQTGKKNEQIWQPLKIPKQKKSSSQETTSTFKIKKSKKASKLSTISTDEEKSDKNITIDHDSEKTGKKTFSGKKGFQYNDYRLYQKKIIISDNDQRTIHFFSKEAPENGKPADLPKDYEVKINRKTGVPYIRKKQK